MRNRFQRGNEDTTSYYSYALHMCHVINTAMSQTHQLEYFYNDFSSKTTYMRRVFKDIVKIHTSNLLDRRSWDEKDDSAPTTTSVLMVRKGTSTWKDNLDIGKMFSQLEFSSYNQLASGKWKTGMLLLHKNWPHRSIFL